MKKKNLSANIKSDAPNSAANSEFQKVIDQNIYPKPTVYQIAVLAAMMAPRGQDGEWDSKSLTERAFVLWAKSANIVDDQNEYRIEERRERKEIGDEAYEDLHPSCDPDNHDRDRYKYPLTFNVGLEVITGSKRTADNYKRFRDFLKDYHQGDEKKADSNFEEVQKSGFPAGYIFQKYFIPYRKWDKESKSKIASENVKERYKKNKTS